jgi:DNA-binding transcriptional MocR family regulator
MLKLGQLPQSKPTKNTKSFNSLKHYIANMVLFAEDEEDLILPSIRHLAEQTGFSKTVVARHLFTLIDNEWIEQKRWGNSPRECFYIATLSFDRAKKFKEFYQIKM